MVQKSDRVTDHPRHAGRVRRYHTWVVHHQQSVGEHCWQVARIHDDVFGWPSPEVAYYIRHHDTAELVVGDPPYPVKSSSPEMKAAYDELEPAALAKMGVFRLPELTAAERHRIKVCDLLEMMEHGMCEREMGNLLAVPIVIRTAQNAAKVARENLTHEEYRQVLAHISREWHRHQLVLKEGDLDHGYGSDIPRWSDL